MAKTDVGVSLGGRAVAGLIVVVLLLAGCAGTPADTATGSASDGNGSPGCGAAASGLTAGTTVVQTLEAGGVERTFRLHLPAAYTPHRAYPLVLAFHGRGETDAQLEQYSGLDRLTVILAYPQGLPGTAGQPGWEGTPFAAAGVDDLGFTGAVIAHLQRMLCVDPAHIDVTGKSDGGGFAALLGCRLPQIDAIATVSAAFYSMSSPCHPLHSVAVIDFHGGDDTVIPYGGEAGRGLQSIPAWLDGWVDRDACNSNAMTFYHGDGVLGQQWSGCRNGAVVQNYRIATGGHTWTGSAGWSGPGGNTTAISATSLIGSFFAAH